MWCSVIFSGQNKYQIYKSIPYGIPEDTLPYLSRRLTENKAVLNGARREKSLLKSALKERMSFKQRHEYWRWTITSMSWKLLFVDTGRRNELIQIIIISLYSSSNPLIAIENAKRRIKLICSIVDFEYITSWRRTMRALHVHLLDYLILDIINIYERIKRYVYWSVYENHMFYDKF